MNTARGLVSARALEAALRPARSTSEASSRYELGAEIATGGMAVIRRGFDHWAQREVAHKRLRVDQEGNRSRMSALFQREYDMLARLKHPNIVEVYDYGFDEQGPYYAMELLSGDDLSKIAPLPYREACRIVRDVASALALVHARRFVHRDVSPNNVRLTSEGVAKLIDFGALTPFGRPSELAGTAAFIAPECLQDRPLDQRADLYSLGALAYWTLTKRTAVVARTIADLDGAWDLPILPPSSYVAGLPAGLDELVLSLLSRSPEARPSSAAEVIEWLSTVAALEPEQNEQSVAYSYLKHPLLVGREQALRELRSALDSTLAGRGEVLVLEAANGLGKSALLDQLAVDAQLRGATVLRAEGSSAEDTHGVARRLIHLGTRVFPDLGGSEAFALSELNLGAGSSNRARHPVEALERNARAAARLRTMLLRLSERTPLVILIDDADLADQESISLLASMANELSQLPILFMLSRSEAVHDNRPGAYEQLAARARRVSVHSLDEPEVVQLVGCLFGDVPNSGRIGVWLHGQTGGNPAQCVDLLRMLMQRGLIRYTRGTFTLPQDVDEQSGQDQRVNRLLTRLNGLTTDSAQIFELVCLHRGSLDQRKLASATGIGARRVLLAVEQLVKRELVFLRGAEVSLRGESMRSAIEQSLSGERRDSAHRLLVNVLAKHSDGSLANELAMARHLFAAGPSGALEAAELMAQLLIEFGPEISTSVSSVPLLESALEVFRAHGVSELHCAPLLAALSTSGFYGNIEAQHKYLRPALRALSELCGFALATRLRPRLGSVLALWTGLIYGLVLGFFLPKKLGRTGIKHRIEDFLLVCSTGTAAAAAATDLRTSADILEYLEPLAGFPARFAPSYARDFCIATSALTRGETLEASQRYSRLLKTMEHRHFALDDRLREQMNLGCLYGKGHAEVDQGSSQTLEIADALERRSAFFTPHAETLRVLYHALRGQHRAAELHRARAEALALRGGLSWTSSVVLAIRTLDPAFLLEDAVGLMRAAAELERVSAVAPSLKRYRDLARADLALLRERPAEALALLEPAVGPGPSYSVENRLLYTCLTEALNRLEQFERARTICLAAQAGLSDAQRRVTSVLRTPHLQLARAEAGLGRPEAAKSFLLACLHDAVARKNPFELGLLHRALAQLALQCQDVQSFDRERSAMAAQWQALDHPALSRHCDALLVEALGAGMKPVLPEGFSSSMRAAISELDGETVIEARPTSSRADSEVG